MEEIQKIIDNVKQSDGSYIKKYRHTSADIVWYESDELDEYGDPIQTSVQDEINNIKENTKNIPNVATNDQTPTYTESETLVKLTSGEKLSVAFGKISKAITDLITHIGDNVKHITSTERTNWNLAKTHADSSHAPVNAQENKIETIKYGDTTFTPNENKEVVIEIPDASNTSGLVKTTSQVTDTTYYTPCPIVGGVPYYKEGTGGSGEGVITTSNSVLIPVDCTLFTLNEETQRYEQVIIVNGMTEGNGGTFDILRSGAVLTEQESLIIANITDIVRQDGSIKVICLEQPIVNYTLVLYGTFAQATDETTLIANMNGWFTRVENLETNVSELNSKIVIGMGTIDMSATGTVNQSIPFGQTFDIIPKAVFAMFQVRIGENAITSIGNITESEFIARAKCVQVGSNADKICWIAVW